MKKYYSLITLYTIGFLFAIHTALIIYSNSSFLHQFIPESSTGLLYSAASILCIIGLLLIPQMIARFGSRISMATLVILTITACIVQVFVPSTIAVIIAFCALFAINTMFFLSNDILIDHVAENQSMGSTRGSYLTALNIGYVLAPSVSGFILARMGFSALYTLAALLLVPLLIIIINNHSIRTIHISKINIFQSMKTLWHNRNVRNIALANFLLQFFYAWMVIYTPIFLHEQLGIPWDSVGTLFSIMLFAFVLTQIPLGRLADRHLGEKYLLIIGFVVISITTSLLFFLPSFTLPLLGLILFGTRIGASCIEVLTESYFFKKVPRDESGEISIFRNMYPIAYIIAPLIGSLVLRWLPVHYLFLILGIILLCGILFIIPIQNTK
jgi:MFS family permease